MSPRFTSVCYKKLRGTAIIFTQWPSGFIGTFVCQRIRCPANMWMSYMRTSNRDGKWLLSNWGLLTWILSSLTTSSWSQLIQLLHSNKTSAQINSRGQCQHLVTVRGTTSRLEHCVGASSFYLALLAFESKEMSDSQMLKPASLYPLIYFYQMTPNRRNMFRQYSTLFSMCRRLTTQRKNPTRWAGCTTSY